LFKIKASIRKKIYLAVADAVFFQRSFGLPDSNDFFQRVVWFSCHGNHLISRSKIGSQRKGKGMGAAGNLRAYESIFGVKNVRIHLLQRISSNVIVAIAGYILKALGTISGILHLMDNFHLILFRELV